MRFLLSSAFPPPRACRMALTRSVTAGRSDSRCLTRYWGSCAVCTNSAKCFRVLPVRAHHRTQDNVHFLPDTTCSLFNPSRSVTGRQA